MLNWIFIYDLFTLTPCLIVLDLLIKQITAALLRFIAFLFPKIFLFSNINNEGY